MKKKTIKNQSENETNKLIELIKKVELKQKGKKIQF